MFKKITAALLCLVMMFSMTGCNANYEKVVTIDGVDIAPNMYLYAQYQAYIAAEGKVEEGENVLKATIEELPAKEWIHNETIRNLKEYVWVQKTMEEKELKLAEDDTAYIEYQVEYYWPYVEESFTDNGIGKETYKKFVASQYSSDYSIFPELYGPEGEREPSDDEVGAYMNEIYANIRYFKLSTEKLDAEGAAAATAKLTTDDTNKLYDLGELAAEEINNGADVNEVALKYFKEAAEINGDKTEYTSENIEKQITERYLPKEGVTSGEEMLTVNAFKIDVDGEWACDRTGSGIVVYQRIKTYEDAEDLATYKLGLTQTLKADDYADYIDAQTKDYEIIEDASAVKYYSVNKIK